MSSVNGAEYPPEKASHCVLGYNQHWIPLAPCFLNVIFYY
uniref:Uncharacterized protein n=1 Tax=Anguilla anguilla TaxID=7936 RepID=A0A0E9S5S3_ANGAN